VTSPTVPFRIVEVVFANFSVPVRERRKGKRRKQAWTKGRERERRETKRK